MSPALGPGRFYRVGKNPADVSDIEQVAAESHNTFSGGAPTALAKVEDVSLARIMDSETARAYIQKVSVPADDSAPYKAKLALSAADDQTAYDDLVKAEKQKFKKRTRLLARWFGKAEFTPSRAEPEKSRKTELLEAIVTINDKLQRDVAVFADIPETLAKNRATYADLLQREAAVRKQIEEYIETYEGAEALLKALNGLECYDALRDDEKEKVKKVIISSNPDTNIDFEVPGIRKKLCTMMPGAKKTLDKINMDLPFARENYMAIQDEMRDIEQYDAGDVKEKFVPAMLALYRLKLRYEKAKVKADTASPAADLDAIIRSCNELVDETDRTLEAVQIEADVDREMRKDAKKTLSNEEVKPVDLISEMKSLLGKPLADVPYAAPVQYAVQPEVIEAEFTEVGKKEA